MCAHSRPLRARTRGPPPASQPQSQHAHQPPARPARSISRRPLTGPPKRRPSVRPTRAILCAVRLRRAAAPQCGHIPRPHSRARARVHAHWRMAPRPPPPLPSTHRTLRRSASSWNRRLRRRRRRERGDVTREGTRNPRIASSSSTLQQPQRSRRCWSRWSCRFAVHAASKTPPAAAARRPPSNAACGAPRRFSAAIFSRGVAENRLNWGEGRGGCAAREAHRRPKESAGGVIRHGTKSGG